MKTRIRTHLPWLLLLLGVQSFATLCIWLADVESFAALVGILIVSGLILFGALCFWLDRKERKKEEAFLEFLENPDSVHEERLRQVWGPSREAEWMALRDTLRQQRDSIEQQKEKLLDYEEYVESWTHEMKVPVSLLTLIMDNHREQFPGPIAIKLDSVTQRIEECASQILVYSRLKSEKKDYLFESLGLKAGIEEVLEDYGPLLEEKGFKVRFENVRRNVFTDRRGLQFILKQLVSNAIKYSQKKPQLEFIGRVDGEGTDLIVRDNGQGIKECDLPFLFEKGFTGDSGEVRLQATGMGLWLAAEIAKDCNIQLSARSTWQQGFEMIMRFPSWSETGEEKNGRIDERELSE